MNSVFNTHSPLFESGSAGITQQIQEPTPSIRSLSEALFNYLGDIITINVWPYRHGAIHYLVCDIEGNLNEASLTIAVTGCTTLPSINEVECGEAEAEAVDFVDALNLVNALLHPPADRCRG